MTNLIVGATGRVGTEICRLLSMKNLPVRAMVRETSNLTRLDILRELGVELVWGDLRKSSTFAPALQGVSNVFVTASSMPFSYEPGINDPLLVDRNGVINLVNEATKAGVNHFIYTSFSGHIDMDFPLRNAKRAVELHLKKSGMMYTILRPSYFMEAWLSSMVGFDPDNAKAQLCGEGDQPVSYISYLDVAKFAVESLNNPAARNAILELGGPDKISQKDAVKIFEKMRRIKFDVQYTPVETLRSQMESAADPMQQSFSGLMLAVAKGDVIDMSDTAKKFHIKLKSVQEYAEQLK
ncbi:MAG: SDR family oxidoreductase [Bacteroidales bacterium]|nr:SDR family oxidoreductase [Bacteroidales bacterium]